MALLDILLRVHPSRLRPHTLVAEGLIRCEFTCGFRYSADLLAIGLALSTRLRRMLLGGDCVTFVASYYVILFEDVASYFF
jgi:hypothetical protein